MYDVLERLGKIKAAGKSEFVDINDIKIDPSQPVDFRLNNFLDQIKNPYYFRCGEVPVIIAYSDSGNTLSEKLEAHFIRQKTR